MTTSTSHLFDAGVRKISRFKLLKGLLYDLLLPFLAYFLVLNLRDALLDGIDQN